MIDFRRFPGLHSRASPAAAQARWPTVAAIVVTALLVVVLNPELRAMLAFVDALGVAVFVLFLALQSSSWWSATESWSSNVIGWSVRSVRRLAHALRWLGRVIVPRDGVWSAASALSTALCAAFVLPR